MLFRLRGQRRRLLIAAAAACLLLLAPVPGDAWAAEPPSIVLVVTDDQRWDTLSAMPIVQRELVAKGVTFQNAFVVNALCCPSRASILTGKYSHSTGVYLNSGSRGGFGAFRDGSTIATWLDAAGYETALVGKYLNRYGGSYIPPGWDRWVAFSNAPTYFGYTLNVDGVPVPFGGAEADYSTDVLAAQASSFIRETSGPLFLYFAPNAPHFNPPHARLTVTPAPRHVGAYSGLEPLRPPSYNEADVSDKPAWLRGVAPFSDELSARIDGFRRSQLESLLAVDDAVGEILAALEETGRLGETLIVFTSDNGNAWGEHRWFSKIVSYEESIRVPLVVRYDSLVTSPHANVRFGLNVDLAPTLAAAAGTAAPGAEGSSILPLLTRPNSSWRRDFLVEHLGSATARVPTYCTVRSDTHSYTQYRTGEEELYDVAADPYELGNLARKPLLRRTLVALRARLRVLCSPPPPGFVPKSICLVDGTSRSEVLRGTRWYDLICGRKGNDVLYGDAGDDALRGGPGKDVVNGQGGADSLAGGRGYDRLYGGSGVDLLRAVDGGPDFVGCGGGSDRAIVDPVDRVAPTCETIIRR